MGDKEAASKLKAWRDADQHRKGSDTELLAIAGAHQSKLFVLCGDRFEASRILRTGEFSARIIRVTGGRSVAMAMCMVGDHQWMLAKDSMAVRVGERAFVFALPGVLYGLCVPWESSELVIRHLEEIFATYCAYQDLLERKRSVAWNQPESEIWTIAYEKLENLAAQSSTKIAAAASSAVKAPASSVDGGEGAINDIAATKIQRAVRMSAAVKLASRALLSGALVPHDHLHVAFPPEPAAALPSVWSLAGLLDAIESSGSKMAAAEAPRGREEGFWWLRMEGVVLLLEVLRAYGAAARKKPKVDAASTSLAAEEEGAGGGAGGGDGEKDLERGSGKGERSGETGGDVGMVALAFLSFA